MPTENGNLRAHYTKTTVRAGEVLRLTAVFQDTRRAPLASHEGKSCRSTERDQYAQCHDARGHELFVPLSARGEFYATCPSGSLDTGSDAVLYRVHQLAARDLPLRVRLVAGPLPIPLPRDYCGLMQLEGATRGPIVLGCTVPLMPERPVANSTIPELLELVASGPTAPRVKRARLGCPSEARLLASPRMQRLLSACRRALDQRATEPRVAPPKSTSAQWKELDLREIKSKAEPKPILQSLKEGLEHIRKSTVRSRAAPRPISNSQSFLERISKIAQSGKSRNPAKKSASFTFAVRPEIAMRSAERYASLDCETNLAQGSSSSSRQQQQQQQQQHQQQQVQRSVSTSVLEVRSQTDNDPPYSKVKDSLAPQRATAGAAAAVAAPLTQTITVKQEDIYAEICELPCERAKCDVSEEKPPPPPPLDGKITRERRDEEEKRGYAKLALSNDNGADEEGIYNTVC